MGDPRRFDALATEVEQRWPDRTTRVIDVAGGKGYLHSALHQRGYHNVTTFDTRARKAHRRHYRYQRFTTTTRVRTGVDLVLAMHPDEATDVAMEWAILNRVPFVVVPCCVKPTVWTLWGEYSYPHWVEHLHGHATRRGYSVDDVTLPIRGRSLALVGKPVGVHTLSDECG